jgi:hypothetical protein
VASEYSRYRRYSRSGRKREILATEEMKKLVPTSRICINAEHDAIYVYDGKAKPVTAPLRGDALTATDLLKQKIMDTFKIREDAVIEWIGLLSDQLLALEESDLEDQEGGKKLLIQKYTKDIPAVEAVLVAGKPMFLQIIDGKVVLSKEIPLPDGSTLYPLDKWSYLNKPYEFSSEEEINTYVIMVKKQSLDDLYDIVKAEWKKYTDADDFHVIICSADTIFSYIQDKLGMTHYLLFVGDVEVGKTNNLRVFEQLAYRALYSVSLTPATIFRSYGSVEEGQVTILEDEIDNIDRQDEKMRIYKPGYQSGAKVPRNDDTPSGRKSQGYFVYGFKAFTSEKQPDGIEAKGFNERTFVIKCFVGYPDYDISEVVSPAGDDDYKTQLDRLSDVRKHLIIYRLLHFNDPIPNIKRLTLKNRDKQLCKPLLRLFQGTKAVDEIASALWKLLKEKKDRKKETIDAAIHKVLSNLIASGKVSQQASLDNDKVRLANVDIEAAIRAELKAKDIPGKPQTWDTEEYGLVSKKGFTSTVKDKFGGDPWREGGLRGVILSKKRLEKLGKNYSSVSGIDWEGRRKPPHDTCDTLGTSIGDTTRPEVEKIVETDDNCNTTSKNIQQTDKNKENIASQTSVKESETSHKVSKVSEVSQTSQSVSPIISVEDFFSNDMPLPGHSIEESPCYPLIGSRPGEIPTDTVYYCKLHPDMIPSTFLTQIELHCRQQEPERHKAAILPKGESA